MIDKLHDKIAVLDDDISHLHNAIKGLKDAKLEYEEEINTLKKTNFNCN